MARGFIGGVVTGTALAAGVGTLASVIAPLPTLSQAPVISNLSPALGQAPAANETALARLPAAASGAPAAPGLVLGQTPQPDSIEGITGVVLLSAAAPKPRVEQPSAPLVVAAVDVWTLPSQNYAVMDTAEVPRVLRSSLTLPKEISDVAAPASPSPLPDASWDTLRLTDIGEPVAAPRLVRAEIGTLPTVPPRRLEAQPLTLAAADQAPETPSSPVRPQAPVAEAAPVEAVVEEIVVAQAVPAPVETPQPTQAAQAQSPSPMPAPAVAQPQTALRPSIGKPAVSLTERRGSVVVRRTADTGDTQTDEVTAEAEAPSVDPNAPPIARFSQSFENPEAKPLMSVVLIDHGKTEIGSGTELAQLRDFPYALSFAVDSALSDAEERVAMYRAEGFEVLSMIDLPAGARATDVETAMGATLSRMDSVVGVLEGVGSGMQGSRQISDQVAQILAETGHGLVTQAKGLNTMPNLARKAGVPADPIFRDFDSNGQDARVIRRFLDQAAFKAGQEGGVIMLGRLRPETISALLVWGLQDRAGQVALAPISAVLTRNR